jgi:arginase family enzyme
MKLADYFDASDVTPSSQGLPKNASIFGKVLSLGISKNISIDKDTLVIFGVNESRNSSNPGAAFAPDAIRKYLYGLSGSSLKHPLVDLGNLKSTANPADTYMALRDVVDHILSKGATCLVLGGTQELTWSIYMAMLAQKELVNISLIDHTIDMGNNDGDFSSKCYIERLINDPNKKLFELNILGYQGYLSSSQHINALTNINHELARLGYVRGAMSEVEPALRDSDIVSLDLGCIKQSDSPGAICPSPNGFYSEEVCQLSRYAGLSSRVKAFGIFELNTQADPTGQSSHLAAQIVWHFIDAFNGRGAYLLDSSNTSTIKRFYVKSPIPKVELLFLHNTTNDTWWMELPATTKNNNIPMIVACSYNDYKQASGGDVPERWLRIWRKLS